MKNLVAMLAAFAGALSMALVIGCEPGAGGDTETYSNPNTDTYTPPQTGQYPAIELEDDPTNPTLSPSCDGGTIKSPGADIDSGALYDANGNLKGYMAQCVLSNQSGCTNDNADASQAEGAPNATGSEEAGGYVSLNGGMIRCNWEGGAWIEQGKGQQVEINEIGKVVERYRVRYCMSTSGNCSKNSGFGTGRINFDVDQLF